MAGTGVGMTWRGGAMRSRSAFTLVEIAVVMLIIGIMATLFIPRLPDIGSWRLKSSARKLAHSIGAVYDKAATSKLVYRMTVDFAENSYYFSLLNTDGSFEKRDILLAKETRLPDGLKFLSVQLPGQGKVEQGEAHIHFFPSGYAEFSAIQLGGDDDESFTLIVHPLTGRVKILDGYQEIGQRAHAMAPAHAYAG